MNVKIRGTVTLTGDSFFGFPLTMVVTTAMLKMQANGTQKLHREAHTGETTGARRSSERSEGSASRNRVRGEDTNHHTEESP